MPAPATPTRRVSPGQYRLLLTAHITTSVGWLGVVFAKLVLGLLAVTSAAGLQLLAAMEALNVAFPPLAIGTLASGVLLSLGTRWGVLQHWWVVTKLVLTVGVVATAVQLADRAAQAALANPSPATYAAVLALTGTHVLMLAAATVLSVYKPWGRITFPAPSVAGLARGHE
jgi:hypothetical protein